MTSAPSMVRRRSLLGVLGGFSRFWGAARRSVLVGAHDGEDARGDGGIGGIGGAPEAADAALVDRAEVVLAMGVVVFGEGVEGADLREQRLALLGRAWLRRPR